MGRRERPVDPTSGPLEAFAFELRLLRTKAGEPSYRRLAQRAGVSASALSAAAGGAVFPSRRVTLAYVSACGADAGEWALRWETLRARLAQPPQPRAQTAGPSWRLPPSVPGRGQMSALAQTVWEQWIQGRLRSSIEDIGLITPRMTDGHGKPIDLAALAGLLHDSYRVVMVGPPGAGKTVAGLCLVRQVIASGADRLPVVIAYRSQPMTPAAVRAPAESSPETMTGWWGGEVERRYGVSRFLAESWLDSGQLLLVLDGLDALPKPQRAAHLPALNAARPCLITCRTGVYEKLASALGPHEVVRIHPLSPVQVQRHLPVEHDPELAELLTVPAILGTALRMPNHGAVSVQEICAEYACRPVAAYPRDQVWQWLSWLARSPAFDSGRLRTAMLSQRRDRWLARSTVLAVVACALALVDGITWAIARWYPQQYSSLTVMSVVAVITATVCLAAMKAESRLHRTVVLGLLVREGALPTDVDGFLHAAHRAGLLDESCEGYQFAHRHLQQYFLRQKKNTSNC